jgi:phage baseplate assembly protein gpV
LSAADQVALGALTAFTTWGRYNNIIFAVQQALAKMQTGTLVRIEACTNAGDLSPVGFVDVTPLVNQIDGSVPANPTQHVTIYGLPYLRMQGGTNAVILDPQPGDIGVAVFASRDISKVKSTKAQANPGSYRQYDFSDGMYLGGMLNAVPVQYVRFGTDGITIVSPTAITLTAPTITLGGAVTVEGALTQSGGDVSITAPDTITLAAPEINLDGALASTGGDATMSGELTTTGDVIAGGKSLKTHVHTSEAVGTQTSPPL